MLRRVQCVMWLAVLLCTCARYGTAQKRDPLTDKEVDQMRESADWPDKRIELMVKFARARMTAIDQLQANPKGAKDRPMQVHDLLEDFSALLDEIEDNVDMYGSHKADMRKGLTTVPGGDQRVADETTPSERTVAAGRIGTVFLRTGERHGCGHRQW